MLNVRPDPLARRQYPRAAHLRDRGSKSGGLQSERGCGRRHESERQRHADKQAQPARLTRISSLEWLGDAPVGEERLV